jgi:aerobic-type carbon monoxide dehydrogenase small subunit (CoxS/CutS family)
MIKFTLNGTIKEVEAPDDTPLLWAIRENLNLKGTKFGCGMAQCGACTVMVDKQATRSCMTPLSAVANKQVTTIEGLAQNGLSALQKAWIQFNVPQCGYCQSGQLMSATALLLKNKKPSDEEIKVAMSGNICRCGTYPRIQQAIKAVASGEIK